MYEHERCGPGIKRIKRGYGELCLRCEGSEINGTRLFRL